MDLFLYLYFETRILWQKGAENIVITHDYSYANKNLIENGYAVYGIHSLNFDRYFTEKEREQDDCTGFNYVRLE